MPANFVKLFVVSSIILFFVGCKDKDVALTKNKTEAYNREIEEKLRKEFKEELEKSKKENQELRQKLEDRKLEITSLPFGALFLADDSQSNEIEQLRKEFESFAKDSKQKIDALERQNQELDQEIEKNKKGKIVSPTVQTQINSNFSRDYLIVDIGEPYCYIVPDSYNILQRLQSIVDEQMARPFRKSRFMSTKEFERNIGLNARKDLVQKIGRLSVKKVKLEDRPIFEKEILVVKRVIDSRIGKIFIYGFDNAISRIPGNVYEEENSNYIRKINFVPKKYTAEFSTNDSQFSSPKDTDPFIEIDGTEYYAVVRQW